MTTTIIQLAKSKASADKVYEDAVLVHIRSFKPLDIDTFWDVVKCLSSNIEQRLNYGQGVKDGIHNLFCSLVYRTGQSVGIEDWPEVKMESWEKMARFLARYRLISSNLHRKCAEMPYLDRGDDGYGDLMDSLPLAGRTICGAIFDGDIADNMQLERAVGDIFGNSFKNFILHGDNYIAMTFEAEMKKSFVNVAWTHGDPPQRDGGVPHCVVNFVPHKVDSSRRHESDCAINITVTGPFNNREEANTYAEKQKNVTMPIKIYKG